jgi:hypothetical protein
MDIRTIVKRLNTSISHLFGRFNKMRSCNPIAQRFKMLKLFEIRNYCIEISYKNSVA